MHNAPWSRLSGAGPPGALAQASAAVSLPAAEVRVTIGGAEAEVLFAGIPPGLAGVMQVNARVPAGSVASSDALLSVQVGDAESRSARLAVE